MVVLEVCCEVDRVVTPVFRFGDGWDGTKTTFGMERSADREIDKSARANRSIKQGGGDLGSNVDKGNKEGEKECMRITRRPRSGIQSGMEEDLDQGYGKRRCQAEIMR